MYRHVCLIVYSDRSKAIYLYQILYKDIRFCNDGDAVTVLFFFFLFYHLFLVSRFLKNWPDRKHEHWFHSYFPECPLTTRLIPFLSERRHHQIYSSTYLSSGMSKTAKMLCQLPLLLELKVSRARQPRRTFKCSSRENFCWERRLVFQVAVSLRFKVLTSRILLRVRLCYLLQ